MFHSSLLCPIISVFKRFIILNLITNFFYCKCVVYIIFCCPVLITVCIWWWERVACMHVPLCFLLSLWSIIYRTSHQLPDHMFFIHISLINDLIPTTGLFYLNLSCIKRRYSSEPSWWLYCIVMQFTYHPLTQLQQAHRDVLCVPTAYPTPSPHPAFLPLSTRLCCFIVIPPTRWLLTSTQSGAP